MSSREILTPVGLAVISQGRDYILTAEFATVVNCATQTIRKNFCQTGHCYGIRPLKIGNRLLWPVADITRLLAGESVGEAT